MNIYKKSKIIIENIHNRYSARPTFTYVGMWENTPNLGDIMLKLAIKKIFGIKVFNRIEYNLHLSRKVINLLSPKIDLAILAGGTLINCSDRALNMAIKANNSCRRKIVFGTGVGDPIFFSKFPDWTNRMDSWKNLLSNYEYIGVRGPLSKKILNSSGIENVDIVGDPILAFSSKDINHNFEEKTIGLNIGRSWLNKGYAPIWGQQEELENTILNLAIFLKNNNYKIKWFVADPRDLEVTQKIAEASQTTEQFFMSYGNENRYLSEASKMHLFVGMKLHSVALAICANVPSIMLEYNPKCLDFMSSINQEKFNINTGSLTLDKLINLIEYCIENRNSIANNLKDNTNIIKSKQQSIANQILNSLGINV